MDAFLGGLAGGTINSGNDIYDLTDRGNFIQGQFICMLHMGAVGENSGHWVCYAEDGALCDEHLIQTGLSALELARCVVYMPVIF